MLMAFMPMCGQTWLCAAASFLAMWVVMMAAMMLPSLVPMLWRYRQAAERIGVRRELLTGLVGLGYLFVWAVLGMAAFPLVTAIATFQMQMPGRIGSIVLGGVILLAGAVQFTAWKARHLASCRASPVRLSADAGSALRQGMCLGLHCVCSCAGITVIMLLVGMMDWRAMAAMTTAITAERLAPAGDRIAQGVGAMILGAGLSLIARAAGVG